MGEKDKTAEAIAFFEDAIRESEEIFEDCQNPPFQTPPRLREELAKQKEYFITALDALRRQQAQP